MNTRHSSRIFKSLFALQILAITLGMSLAQAGNQGVQQLPRVVITGKSLQSQGKAQTVVTLPRVVVVARRHADKQLAACQNDRQAGIGQASTRQC